MSARREPIRAVIVDDESLATRRLERLVKETERVEIVGISNDSEEAVALIDKLNPDVVFLDIKMPVMDGFEVLDRLRKQPPVIFTTAFDQHSLEAFEYLSVAYLVKPVERTRLEDALDKLEKFSGQTTDHEPRSRLFNEKDTLRRIASRVGNKIRVIDVAGVTHFYSEDKVTFASIDGEPARPLEQTLSQLEESLDNSTFVRIHRGTIINLEFIDEIVGNFAEGMRIKLKGGEQLSVARGRVKDLKSLLGL